jgi:hypothetical protein
MVRVSEINVDTMPRLLEGGLQLHEPMTHIFLGVDGYYGDTSRKRGGTSTWVLPAT